MLEPDAAEPAPDDVELAGRALASLRDHLVHSPDGPHRLRLDGDESLVLPDGAMTVLVRALAHLAAGRAVSVLPVSAELTTQQAADLLVVSRPYLIGLLDAGEIDYRMVGTHRRVLRRSLLAFRRRDDERRDRILDELTALGQEIGAD